MLNPSFKYKHKRLVKTPYRIDGELADQFVTGNRDFDTGPEYRIQEMYTSEIWSKLERLGLHASDLSDLDVLEVCGGTGFLTYHLLKRASPRSLMVNEISINEINEAKNCVDQLGYRKKIVWNAGDLYDLEGRFDLVIGNSFLHHFADVPRALAHIANLTKPGGTFITVHEPTPMSTVVESAKLFAVPLMAAFPALFTDLIRLRHKTGVSPTDIWMFEKKKIADVAIASGFTELSAVGWHLCRAITVQQINAHLSSRKTKNSEVEIRKISRSIQLDSKLNRLLPSAFFGSLAIRCKR